MEAGSGFRRGSGGIPVVNSADAESLVSDASGSPNGDPELRKINDPAFQTGVGREANDSPAITPADQARCLFNAAIKLQKVYRSYRTRRMLADSAVVAKELWWQALDFARLNHSTISFFNNLKPERSATRWNRVSFNASKVGKGLYEDENAQKLAFQHWIEAIDPRHRYGHNLHYYYNVWCESNAGQPFFYWLDVGGGKGIDLKECPRSKLHQQCIKYLGPKERERYEFMVIDGKVLHKLTGNPLNTNTAASSESKWIFVMSASKRLYAGEKKKGLFHHSSFLAGGTTLAAGRLTAEDGVLKCVSDYSGHYKPTDNSLILFLSFLKENGVNLHEIQIQKATEYSEHDESGRPYGEEATSDTYLNGEKGPHADTSEAPNPESRDKQHMRSLSKKASHSYQLDHQFTLKWLTGAGSRCSCLTDYPLDLRLQALQLTKTSQTIHHQPLEFSPGTMSALLSPSAQLLNQRKEGDAEALDHDPG